MAPHAVRVSAGKLQAVINAAKLSWNTIRGQWHTAEYEAAFYAPDWLYSSRHGINISKDFYICRLTYRMIHFFSTYTL